MIIGICGKSGSGKSTIAKEIVEHYQGCAKHLDIDKVGHHVLTLDEVKQELVTAFGEAVIKNNQVDRKALSVLVFSSNEKMDILTAITWRYMEMEIDAFLKNNSVVILDWALLPKTKFFEMCDYRILLDIPYEVRKERAVKRDNITEDAFALRDSAGMEYDKSAFDYVIQDGDEKEIKGWVKLL